MDLRRLGIYLNDHLAGAVGGEELAKRCLSENRGTPLGAFLERLVEDVQADRAALERLMGRLGVRRDPWKSQASWLLEKLGRLKLNGGILSYSDLSRLEELESLSLGVEGKASMWRALQPLSSDPRLRDLDLGELEKRAQRQREELEAHRLEAARGLTGR
jgi:hypothetical protein